ncbi:MAG: hypothetical protein OXU62_06080 [Gammaproteobacteria bacterium]|nr:hypothetical protein [Gammaproteobacteria bacterium]
MPAIHNGIDSGDGDFVDGFRGDNSGRNNSGDNSGDDSGINNSAGNPGKNIDIKSPRL